ncbi:unannotated protein [freshwater metagenome]|uniref:Unannotated protein n=1 Tax=freshwater metagenome TaxID=449393 RepID=A0A6J6WW41_9ZZZZ
MSPCEFRLNISVIDNYTLFDVHEEHATRLKPAFGNDIGRLYVQDAYFG